MEYAGFLQGILEYILQWICNFFGNICQLICGVIFNCMDSFMSASNSNGTTLTEEILSPVLELSNGVLVPLGIELLVLIVAWNLLITMFGKFSTSQDEPLVLIVRAAIFILLILNSGTLIETVSTKFVNPIVTTMYNMDYETVDGAAEAYKTGTENGMDGVNELMGGTNFSKDDMSPEEPDLIELYEGEDTSSDEFKNETVAEAAGTGIGVLGLGIAASAGGFSGIGAVIVAMLLYFAVYAILVLVVAWTAFTICIKFVQRQVSFYVVLYMAPLTLATAPSKQTQRIFGEWCKMVATYAISLIMTAAFLAVAGRVIVLGFTYSGSTNIIETAMCFFIIFHFLKLIKNLESYLDKLGLNAVGWQDRNFLGMALSLALSKTMSNGLSRLGSGGSGSSSGNFITNGLKSIFYSDGNKMSNIAKEATSAENSAIAGMIENGNAENMIKGTDGEFQYARGEDGMMHQLDENGNALDGAKLDDSGDVFMSKNDPNNFVDVEGKDSLSTLAGVEEVDGTQAIEDKYGDYYMDKNGVAISKDSIDGDEFYDKDGNSFRGGINDDRYAATKDGSFVNVGNGATYSMHDKGRQFAVDTRGNLKDVSGLVDDKGNLLSSASDRDKKWFKEQFGSDKASLAESKDVKYKNSSNSSTYVNAKTGNVYRAETYNTNIPKGASIVDMNRITFSATGNSGHFRTGSMSGVAKHTLKDGRVCYRNYKVTEINETNRDEFLAKAHKNKSDPGYGYTPNGKYFVEMGDELPRRIFK